MDGEDGNNFKRRILSADEPPAPKPADRADGGAAVLLPGRFGNLCNGNPVPLDPEYRERGSLTAALSTGFTARRGISWADLPLPDESWATPLYRAAALYCLGGAFQQQGARSLLELDMPREKKELWHEVFILWSRKRATEASGRLLAFKGRNSFGGLEEELLYARAMMLDGKGYSLSWNHGFSHLKNLAKKNPDFLPARLELFRADPESILGADSFLESLAEDGIQEDVRLAAILDICGYFVHPVSEERKPAFVRELLSSSIRTGIPRWYLHNPYTPAGDVVLGVTYTLGLDEILARVRRLYYEDEWKEKLGEWAFAICDLEKPAEMKPFCSGTVRKQAAELYRASAERVGDRSTSSILLTCAAFNSFKVEIIPERSSIEAGLLHTIGGLLGGGVSGKNITRLAKAARLHLASGEKTVSKLPWNNPPDLLLCLLCYYWEQNVLDFDDRFDRNWDAAFDGLARSCKFVPDTVSALTALADCLTFHSRNFDYAGKLYSAACAALDGAGEKRLYRVYSRNVFNPALAVDEMTCKFELTVAEKTEVRRMLMEDGAAAPMIQWLSLPARKSLAEIARKPWERWRVALEGMGSSYFLPPPNRALVWFRNMISATSCLQPCSDFINSGVKEVKYRTWEMRRKFARYLFFTGKYREAAEVVNNALVKCDDTVTRGVKDTLVFDLCRLELYAAAHRDMDSAGETAEAAARLENVSALLQAIPDSRMEERAYIEIPRLRIEIIKALHELNRKEDPNHESFYNHQNKNERLGHLKALSR